MSGDPSTWWWVIRVNSPRGWRQRIAHWLHGLAVRIDNRWSIAVEVESDPPIGTAAQAAVIKAGMKHAERLLSNEVETAACERVMRAHMPHLFRDRQHG